MATKIFRQLEQIAIQLQMKGDVMGYLLEIIIPTLKGAGICLGITFSPWFIGVIIDIFKHDFDEEINS